MITRGEGEKASKEGRKRHTGPRNTVRKKRIEVHDKITVGDIELAK